MGSDIRRVIALIVLRRYIHEYFPEKTACLIFISFLNNIFTAGNRLDTLRGEICIRCILNSDYSTLTKDRALFSLLNALVRRTSPKTQSVANRKTNIGHLLKYTQVLM
jgi:hypothetical protein